MRWLVLVGVGALAMLLAVELAIAGPRLREDFRQENSPANLKALMLRLRGLIHDKRDLEAAERLFTGLLPDKDRLKQALAESVSDEAFERYWALHLRMSASKPDFSRLCAANQTEVQVHGATTEEIAAYKQDSVAFAEFPGGARQLAVDKQLRPGMKFYEVEYLEPGKTAGMKYHLFFWDGKQWTMAGPLWRAGQR